MEGTSKSEDIKGFARESIAHYELGVVDKPFVGAQPRLLREPEIASKDVVSKQTDIACMHIAKRIEEAAGVLVVIGDDASAHSACHQLLQSSCDAEGAAEGAPVVVGMAGDWLHTVPRLEPVIPPDVGQRLLIRIGTPSGTPSIKALDKLAPLFDAAYDENRLIVLCRSVCMLPLGTQEQNLFAVDSSTVIDAIACAVEAKGSVAWGHGVGSKNELLAKGYGMYKPTGCLDSPMPLESEDHERLLLEQSKKKRKKENGDSMFDMFARYVRFLNEAKLARPELPVLNYYDTGLMVGMTIQTIVKHGLSLLTDGDGIAMLRDGSIGHTISKLNQIVTVDQYAKAKGVYNVYIGDGACRLNGGMETAIHLIESYKAESMITLFVFQNQKWAIEDALVGVDEEEEHKLYNDGFYDSLRHHPKVHTCSNTLELQSYMYDLSRKTADFLAGTANAEMSVVVVHCEEVSVPQLIGDMEPFRKSCELAFMRESLGLFAKGCKGKVPLYGCSAVEYITFLSAFMNETPEGELFQYICGRTDIQAAQMCGFRQPEDKCVLFINDVYGVHSLGESLRMVLSTFGGKQLLIFIWHPPLDKVIDHFFSHRPPMVWPSMGPKICEYYTRTEMDAAFFEYDGFTPTTSLMRAIEAETPLIVVNMMPKQERNNHIALDVRVPVSLA